MAISRIKASFPCDLQKVWDTVTSLENYQWRSDLCRIETTGKGQFTEYTKSGFPTVFTITVFQPCSRWEFEMENKNMTGYWSGSFWEKDGETKIEFVQEAAAKKLILKPFIKRFLQKQQERYISDLRKALE